MAQISKRVREVVRDRLAITWPLVVDGLIADYAITPAEGDRLVQIDWTGTQKKQFFQGQIDPDSLAETTTTTYPIVILYVSSIQHDGLEKFVTFSGSATINLEFWWMWREGRAIPNFEEILDLVEDALIQIFHDHDWLGALSSITYTGEMTMSRTPVVQAEENWRQGIAAQMRFGVDV